MAVEGPPVQRPDVIFRRGFREVPEINLTGGEIVRDRLLAEGVPYLVGIPGHGIVAILDAFRTSTDRIKVLQVRHEQSAVHLADGYYRVAGKPLAVFTSI